MEIYRTIHNPYRVVEMFEEEVANYTGAPYAVAVDSCTNALFLCCRWWEVGRVELPSETYLSVPQAIMAAGGSPFFNAYRNGWSGVYQLGRTPIWDAAKRFTSGMYQSDQQMCLSFHDKKILKIGKGGMILTDDPRMAAWFRLVRYEGRSEILYKEDDVKEQGWNMYMTPEQAARGMTLMRNIPMDNDDLQEEGGYKDLTEYSLFKDMI